MSTQHFAKTLAWLFGVMLCAGLTGSSEAAPPNIVVILADDLGWRDLGCYGTEFYETPNIDRLAKEGVRFTAAYSACPVCSPTRASLMTGKYPTRVGITDYISTNPASSKNKKLLTPDNVLQLPHDEQTIAELVKPAGYRTFYAGKWHLGLGEFEANSQGFDEYVSDSTLGKHETDWEVGVRITDAAVKYLDRQSPTQPFFMFVSYHEPHRPMLEYPRHIARFQKKSATLANNPEKERTEHDGLTRIVQDDATYASEIAGLDENVGRVLDQLDASNLSKNTIIVFFSDNGGLSTLKVSGPTSNMPLRAGKGWLYEGGIRVPMIVRYPGVAQAGTTCDVPVCSIDLAPTLTEVAGVASRPGQHKDGISVLGLIKGGTSLPPRQLCWHYPHYHSTMWKPGGAIREGDWKLIEFFESNQAELYNLKEDLGEQHDLARQDPAKVSELRKKLADWRQTTGAKMPIPNPDMPPDEKK